MHRPQSYCKLSSVRDFNFLTLELRSRRDWIYLFSMLIFKTLSKESLSLGVGFRYVNAYCNS